MIKIKGLPYLAGRLGCAATTLATKGGRFELDALDVDEALGRCGAATAAELALTSFELVPGALSLDAAALCGTALFVG